VLVYSSKKRLPRKKNKKKIQVSRRWCVHTRRCTHKFMIIH